MEARRAFAQFIMRQPDFPEWKAANPHHHDDWGVYEAYEHINARIVRFMYSLPLIWPDFVEHDGLLLRDTSGKSPEQWGEYLQQFKAVQWSDSQIEYVVNHIHLSQTMFTADPLWNTLDPSIWSSLANIIADMWWCRLHSLFPQRNCAVNVDTEESVIYAYTIRDE